MIPRALRLGSTDLEGERLRAEVAQAVVGQVIPAHARIVRDLVFVGAVTQDVAHGLGRSALGYFPVNVRGAVVTFYRTVMGDEVERSLLRLTSSAVGTATVDMVVW